MGERPLKQAALLFVVFITGAILSFSTYYFTQNKEKQAQKAEFTRHAMIRVNSIQREIVADIEMIQSLHSLFISSGNVTRDEFMTFAGSAIERHQSIQALEWIPRVRHEERSLYEQRALIDGYPGFEITERVAQGQMARAKDRGEYFPVFFVEPYRGNEMAVGFDLASEPSRFAALKESGDTGEMIASGRITLVQEKEQQYGFLVYMPVYEGNIVPESIEKRREKLAGFVLGVFRLKDIMEKSWLYFKGNGIDVSITDMDAEPEESTLYVHSPGKTANGIISDNKGLHYSSAFDVAGRRWQISCTPNDEFVIYKTSGTPIFFLIFGLIGTLILTAYIKVINDKKSRMGILAEELSREIEERNITEKTLRDSEFRYRGLIEDIPALVCRFKPGGFLSFVNKPYCEFFKSTEEQLIGKSFLDFLCDKDRNTVLENLSTLNPGQTSITYEHQVLGPDGAMRWQLWSDRAIYDETGVLVEFQSVGFDITDKKLSEESLRKSEATVRLIVENIPDAIFRWSVENGLEYISHNVERITGYTSEELMKNPKAALSIVASKKAEIIEDYERAVTSGNAMPLKEIPFQRKDGTDVWLEIRTHAVRNEKDGIVAFEGVLSDITERTAIDAKLRENEHRFRTLFQGINEGIILHDSDGLILDVNEETCSRLNYRKEQLVGKNIREIVRPENARHVHEQIEITQSDQRVLFETVYISKDGQEIYCEVSERALDFDNRPVFLSVSRDITDKKRAELKLDRSLRYQSALNEMLRIPLQAITLCEQMEQILDSLFSIPWLELEARGIVFKADVNGGYLEIVASRGIECEALESCSRVPIGHCLCGHAAKTGEIIYSDSCDPRHDRSENGSHHAHYCIPVFYNGHVSGLVDLYPKRSHFREEDEKEFLKAAADVVALIFLHNQTENEKEELQTQLLQSQKIESIGELAGGVAHDFNNMLTVIMGNAQLGAMTLSHEDKHYANYNAIIQASENARDLTMKLLTFARKDKLHLKTIHINSIVEELVAVMKRSYPKKIRLKLNLDDSSPKVKIDKNQVFQGLLNICNNAKDAMPSGGMISIRTMVTAIDDSAGRMHAGLSPGRYCIIEISDTGIGMTDDVKNKIFEPFFTTKGEGKGTGLGLSVTYGVIKNHGGIIDVDSEVGAGTCLRVVLPIFIEEQAEPLDEVTDDSHELHGQGETILIVDDEKSVLDLVDRMLKSLGYRTIAIDSGREAVNIYKKHHQEIDVVILDIMMPDMDGHDVYKEIMAITPNARIILSSGFCMDGKVSPEMSERVKGFIQKPFRTPELLAAIRKALNSAGSVVAG